jgi:CRP/FNR family nitrogen fixation transcriptional regulator
MKTRTAVNSSRILAERAILAKSFAGSDAAPWIGSVLQFVQEREIFAEGKSAEYFYKVVSGVVRTCKFLLDGRRQIEAFHIAGDIFGLEPGLEYRFSAEAVSDCTVIAYRKNGMDADRALSQDLLSLAMQGMVRAQDHSLLLGRRSAMEKVAGFLLDWAEKTHDHGTVHLAMTRQDIADYLGLTIETVSRTLSQLERDSVIDLPSARQIRLRNLDVLEDLAA